MKPWAVLPALAVRLGDVQLSAAEADSLVTVRVRQAVLAPAQCELVFRDPADGLIARGGGLPGTGLQVVMDDVGGGAPVFTGEVTAVDLAYGANGERELRVRGYDRLHRLRKRQPVRMFAEVGVTNLAERLAADCGLEVDSSVTGPTWPLLMQWDQSDLDLLVDAAGRAGLYFAAFGGTLQIFSLEGTGEEVPLTLGDTLFEARLEVNGEHAIAAVHAASWDPLTGRRSDAEATAARSGRAIGADVVAGAFGSDGRRTLVDLALPGAGQAEAAAQAALDRAAAARVALWGVAQGNAALRPGVRVEIGGVTGPFAGTYVLTEVIHAVDADRGYLSEISSRPPATPPPAAAPRPDGCVVTPGLVTRVDDPEGLGRVQASLPTYPSLATGWMRVVLPAAGRDKGLVCLPDVDDEVLVILPRGDPSLGLVLGGLYGAEPPPDDKGGVAHGAVRRYTWRTPGGQQVQLDDDKNRIVLANRDGSSLELAPKKVELNAVTDLDISAPGHRITIRAANVDFRKA